MVMIIELDNEVKVIEITSLNLLAHSLIIIVFREPGSGTEVLLTDNQRFEIYCD